MKDQDILPTFKPGFLELGRIPLYQYQRSLIDELADGLTAAEALRMLERMLTIRHFEQKIVDMKDGKFKPYEGFSFIGATHLSLGQEAVAVGSMCALRPQDYITSTHRGHGHSIAKGAYFLDGQDEQGLCSFLGIEHTGQPWQELWEQAQQEHLRRTMCELLGKEEGYCRGRGGGMHIADFGCGHLGANAIVGGSLGIATGAAMSCEFLGTGQVVLCMIGDGAANNGICHESFNMASMGQFEQGLPVIYLVENNQYGMTGQSVGEVTGVAYLSQRGAGYNAAGMHAETVDGMSVLAVRDALQRALKKARSGQGPVLLEAMTYRYLGHSLSDPRTSYRTKEEEEAWKAKDAVATFRAALIEAGVVDEAGAEAISQRAWEAIDRATWDAVRSPDPNPQCIYEGLFADTTSQDIGDKYRTTNILKPWNKVRRDSEGRILYRQAVAEALAEEMERDRRVILYGEDVGEYGGAFQVTRGLLDTFGRPRVFNTAISEAAIVGSGVGAAISGLRPVVELMYIDFVLMAMDQVGNQAAKVRYMFGGKATCPLVIRTTIGGGKGYAGQHSQSLEAVLTMFPGLKVVAPSTPYDTKGLLKAAIRDDNPVIFIEHQLLYVDKGPVPEDDYLVPLGEAVVRRPGSDLTIVAYSKMASYALEAAEMLAQEGIQAEVVDPRTLIPLDVATINASVAKTGRALLVCQAPSVGCFAEHIAYEIQQGAFDSLRQPIKVVAACDVPPPMAAPLEQANLPDPGKIAAAARELMR